MTTFLRKCALWAFRHPWWALLIIAAMATHGCTSFADQYQAAVEDIHAAYEADRATCSDQACLDRTDWKLQTAYQRLDAAAQAAQVQAAYWAAMAPALGQSMGQFGQAIGDSINPPLTVFPKHGISPLGLMDCNTGGGPCVLLPFPD